MGQLFRHFHRIILVLAINFSNEQRPGHDNSIEQITSVEYIQSTTVEETPHRHTKN